MSHTEHFCIPDKSDELGEEGVALGDFVFAKLGVGLEGEVVGLDKFHELGIVYVSELTKGFGVDVAFCGAVFLDLVVVLLVVETGIDGFMEEKEATDVVAPAFEVFPLAMASWTRSSMRLSFMATKHSR